MFATKNFPEVKMSIITEFRALSQLSIDKTNFYLAFKYDSKAARAGIFKKLNFKVVSRI